MHRFCLILLTVLSVRDISFGQQKYALLITEKSFAGITNNTGIADLERLFGKQHVKDDIDYGPEGADTIQVTKVYPDNAKEIVVFWKKNGYHKRVASLEAYQVGSPYSTADGLKIGTKLGKLLQVNGHALSFSGPGWDYGGYISSFHKGKLAHSNINYQLFNGDGLPDKLLGDVQLSTDMPLVKKNLDRLYIGRITLVLSKSE